MLDSRYSRGTAVEGPAGIHHSADGRLPRLEKKGALRRVKRISNATIVEAAISRDEAHTTLIDELLSLFDNPRKALMARLVESGRLTLEDIKEAEDALRKMTKKGKSR